MTAVTSEGTLIFIDRLAGGSKWRQGILGRKIPGADWVWLVPDPSNVYFRRL